MPKATEEQLSRLAELTMNPAWKDHKNLDSDEAKFMIQRMEGKKK